MIRENPRGEWGESPEENNENEQTPEQILQILNQAINESRDVMVTYRVNGVETTKVIDALLIEDGVLKFEIGGYFYGIDISLISEVRFNGEFKTPKAKETQKETPEEDQKSEEIISTIKEAAKSGRKVLLTVFSSDPNNNEQIEVQILDFDGEDVWVKFDDGTGFAIEIEKIIEARIIG